MEAGVLWGIDQVGKVSSFGEVNGEYLGCVFVYFVLKGNFEERCI